MKDTRAGPLRLGWAEWVALPGLGLPALKAKIDTGARTSALHAHAIEPFGPIGAPRVRFAVHPIPGREDVAVTCEAAVIDRREVTVSTGETERRWVIATDLAVGDRQWPVELGLTARSAMAYRMLIGRQALGEDVLIVPGESFCQPRLGYGGYRPSGGAPAAGRLRIAVLSRAEGAYSTRRLVEEGEARGHEVQVLDTRRLYMAIDALAPGIHCGGRRLPRFDAVIPRIGASVTAYGAAVLRQFETLGSVCLNSAEGVQASRDKLHAHQILARHRIAMPLTAFASRPEDTAALIALAGQAPLVVKLLESAQGRGVVLAPTRRAAESVISAFRGLHANFLVQKLVAEAEGADIRCLVIGGRVAAAMLRRAAPGDFRSNLHQGGRAEPVRLSRAERALAERAARAFGLGLAGVDLLRAADGPKVLEVNSSPGLEGIERVTGRNLAARVLAEVERRCGAARTAPEAAMARRGAPGWTP
jgi:ribosomal protein S6--L-glutamate ligase